jgi:DNA-binding NarL/FixJ family response regulator
MQATQAMIIGKGEDYRYPELLHEAECQLINALATARETIARCEQVLSMLAEARSRLADEQLSPLSTDSCHASLTRAQNGRTCHDALRGAADLTIRETEVLRLIAAGHSNRQIADTLFLSPRTIERHIANIYLKIDAHSKTEATSYARQYNLA